MAVKNAIASIANHSRIIDSYGWARRQLTRSQVAILIYHRVCPQDESGHLRSTAPDDFAKQIKYFRQHYEILSLESLSDYLRSGKRLPQKAIVITFDDGYKDNYLYAYPVLKTYDIPATVFLTTGYIGSDKLFWWDELTYALYHTSAGKISINGLMEFNLSSEKEREKVSQQIIDKLKKLPEKVKDSLLDELRSRLDVITPLSLRQNTLLDWDEIREMSNNSSVLFGAHSVNHPILTNIPLDEARREIVQSKHLLEREIGRDVTAFSYPNGFYNSDIMQIVQESGFSCAVALTPRKLISANNSPYNLPRMSVINFEKFKIMFSGLWGDLAKLGLDS